MRRPAHLREVPRVREPWRDPLLHSTIGEWLEAIVCVLTILAIPRIIAWIAIVTQ